MAKQILYPLLAEADALRVQPVLDALKDKGFLTDGKAPEKAGTVLFFLSENLTDTSPELDEFLRFDAQGVDIIPVRLDGTTPPPLIENAIMARNSISAERYSAQELADRIADAVRQPAKTVSNMRKWIIAAAIIILLAAIGILLWRLFAKKDEPAPTTEASTPAPTTTVPALPGDIPPEDAERIREIVFVGDVYKWYTEDDGDYGDAEFAKKADDIAYRYEDDAGVHWASKEDGHEYLVTHYDNLEWLTALPNLTCLSLINMDGPVPDLAGLSKLDKVYISDTELTDLSFLRGASLTQIEYTGNNVSSFSALNDCPELKEIDLDLFQTTSVDFSDFAPAFAESLNISNGSGISPVDLSGLKGKAPQMKQLILYNLTPADLSFLEGMEQLECLELRFMSLRRLDGIEGLKNLKTLVLQDVSDLEDISAVAGCTALEVFSMIGYPDNVTVSDLSALGKLPNLYYLSNVAAMNTDLDFLKELPTKENICFVLVNLAVTDYSGFAAIKSYDWIYMNMETDQGTEADPAPALAYLQESDINVIHLRNAVNVDLSLLSQVLVELSLETCDIRNFTTLSDEAAFRYLDADDCPYLQSLDGIEKIRDFGTKEDGPNGVLYLENCPRLTDWSALDGLHLETLYLVGMDSVPDFSTFTADTYYLEGVSGLTDLTCFEGLDPAYKYSFDLSGQDGLTDISTLYKLKGGHLCVRPEWRGEAEALVAEGIFESYEVRYPDGSWQPNDSEFRLLSLDELETLPKTVLARVTSLSVAGDTVYNEEEYHVEEDWSNDPPVLYLCPNDPDNGERVPVEPGTRLTDLSVLKDLTSLRRLRLCLQPAETLNGLQYLETLEELSAEHCEALTDVSAAFTLQNLTSISLRRDSGVTSLQGIQNLPMLTRLTLEGCQITDVSPLGEIDTSLDFLDIDGTDCRIWTAFLKDTPIRAMEICDCQWDNDSFAAFIAQHPEAEEIDVRWNPGLTDLSPLPALRNLQKVMISNDMADAAQSLGEGYAFDLEIRD